MLDISHNPPNFPDVRNFDPVGNIVRLPFLLHLKKLVVDSYCCLQFIFDAELSLVKRLMIGQSKMYWTAYQTFLLMVWGQNVCKLGEPV